MSHKEIKCLPRTHRLKMTGSLLELQSSMPHITVLCCQGSHASPCHDAGLKIPLGGKMAHNLKGRDMPALARLVRSGSQGYKRDRGLCFKFPRPTPVWTLPGCDPKSLGSLPEISELRDPRPPGSSPAHLDSSLRERLGLPNPSP